MKKVVPSRITEAREARAFSMGDLADSLNITRQSVSKYERGIISPLPEVLQQISRILDFPEDYFYKPEGSLSAINSPLFFRSNAGIAKKVKAACEYQVKWVDEIREQLARYASFLKPDLPTINKNYEDLSFEEIEELALATRKAWNLHDDPITDLIGLLENYGFIVAELSPSKHCLFTGIDAFSSWRNGIPYILYDSTRKSAVRVRFSILHEVGHLILHAAISSEEAIHKEIIDFADSQADRFAAAFLLPATSFPAELRGSSLSSFEAIKRKWGVSFATIIRRCETLDLLTENQLQYLKRQMTERKYWHKEPLDDVLKISGPEMLRDAVYLLIENKLVSRDGFLIESALSPGDLKRICSLPDEFFEGYNKRQKPILRIL